MDVRSGSYTGNGSSQTISTGASATPKLVLVKSASTDIGVYRTDTMATDSAKPFTGATALATGCITALGAGSFSVGSDARVNTNAVTYYWIALAHDGVNNDIETGQYTGNATDNQNKSLSVITATPDAVWIASEGAERAYFRTSDFSGDLAQDFGGGAQALNNIIQSFGAATFQIGNRASTVNTSSTVYHWLALVNAANLFKVITYNGDGADDRSITGAGFTPGNSFTKRGNSTNPLVIHPKGLGDSSSRIDGASGGFTTNKIQAAEADGFQVGSDADANIATLTPPYYAFVFKDTPASGQAPRTMQQQRLRRAA